MRRVCERSDKKQSFGQILRLGYTHVSYATNGLILIVIQPNDEKTAYFTNSAINGEDFHGIHGKQVSGHSCLSLTKSSFLLQNIFSSMNVRLCGTSGNGKENLLKE